VLVVAEALPLRFIGVGKNNALERDGGESFGALVVALLGCRQQWVQHLDGRLEHLDKFQQPLVGLAQPAGIGIGIGIVLAVGFQLANIHLADQGGNILVVFVTGFGLGNGQLVQHRRSHFHHPKLAQGEGMAPR